jgi:hypothetical protein
MDVVISESGLLKIEVVTIRICFYKYKYKCGTKFLREYGYGNGNIRI